MISVLFASFVVSVSAMIMADRHEKSCSSAVENKQPEIHIHNNSYGGNCTSTSYGGSSASGSNGYGGQSDSRSRGGSNSINTTTDNVSETIIRDEFNRLREDMMKQQNVDMETLECLDRLEQLMNRGK